MCMRLVVCAKQQKPMARLPGPPLRLAARVVRTCLVRQSSVIRKRRHIGPYCVSHLIDCAAEDVVGTRITNPGTPLVLLTICPISTLCRIHGIRLRHTSVGPMFAWWSRDLRKSGLPRVDRHNNALATAEATPSRIYRNPVGKDHGPRDCGIHRSFLRRKMVVWKTCPEWRRAGTAILPAVLRVSWEMINRRSSVRIRALQSL